MDKGKIEQILEEWNVCSCDNSALADRLLEEFSPKDEYISKQALLDKTVKRNHAWLYTTNSEGKNLKEIVEELPPADVRENKHGHWEVVSDGYYGDNAYICECSECKDTVWVYKDADRKWNYCPNCGSDMRGVSE